MQFKAFCKTHNFLKPESIHPYVQLSKKKTCPKYVFISIIVVQGPTEFPLMGVLYSTCARFILLSLI